ncbi:MAG: ABC transporter permease subunit [Candidatus Hydrogenedens sp.]|nr:ABC transporter permease subunit [Candidatus Hydrogenedens sp.]
MTRRFWSALEVELYKAVRQRLVWLGVMLCALLTTAVSLRFDLTAAASSRYLYIAHAAPATLNVIGVMLLVLFAATLVAGETANGTLRGLVLRRVNRLELFMAKWAAIALFSLVLVAVTLFSGWMVAMSGGPMTGVIYGGDVVFTGDRMLKVLLICGVSAWVPLFTAGTLALAVSCFSRSALGAAATVLGVWAAIEALKYPLRLESYVFTTYLETPWVYYAELCDGFAGPWMRPMIIGGIICGCTIAVSAAAGAWRMVYRDVTL